MLYYRNDQPLTLLGMRKGGAAPGIRLRTPFCRIKGENGEEKAVMAEDNTLESEPVKTSIAPWHPFGHHWEIGKPFR